jgi:hypothetical protein
MHIGEELVIKDQGFYVPADNYEDFDEKLDPAKLGERFVQTNPLKGSIRGYQYYANSYLLLNLVEKKHARVKNFRVKLNCLSAEPEHYKVIIWKWLYNALAAGILAILSFAMAITTDIVKPEYLGVAGTVASTIMLILILIFFYQMRDEYIFKSRFGGVKLFVIENRKPDPETFNRFLSALEINIINAQSKSPIRDSLVNELKMCRRLRDESIIDDETYTAARTVIFKHEKY